MSEGAEDLRLISHRPMTRRFVRWAFLNFYRIAFRLRIEGLDLVPPTGPLIVISNHLHNVDPLIVGVTMPRATHFMAKAEAFKNPILRQILKWGGAFPVERGKMDRTAIRRAEETLKQELALGIYPEGTRSRTRSLKEPMAGAGLLALRSGAPVLPVVITGSERLPGNGSKGKIAEGAVPPDPGHTGVRLKFGPTFTVPREIDGRKLSSAEAADFMMIELAKMLPPDYRGIYADRV
jgi:1-acyl-sn-glycerol-3-phosphate acyltransferase